MEPEIKIIQPGQTPEHLHELRWVRKLSRLLDSQFIFPGTNIRFGLDPIFSLIPIVGDIITFVVSSLLIYTMYQHGASRKVVILMIINSTFDAVIGAIPVVGTFFDVAYRSNERNLKLLKDHYLEGKHQGSGNGILIAVASIAIILIATSIYGIYKLMEIIFS